MHWTPTSSDTEGESEADQPLETVGDFVILQPTFAADSDAEDVDMYSNSLLSMPNDVQQQQPEKRTSRRAKRRRFRAPILEKCGCKAECGVKIGPDRKVEINSLFWELSKKEQLAFVLQFSQRYPIKRLSEQSNQAGRRQYTYDYQLEDARGVPQEVCCAFFLNTLGYDVRSRLVPSLTTVSITF